MVVVAKITNATLVLPYLYHTSRWADDMQKKLLPSTIKFRLKYTVDGFISFSYLDGSGKQLVTADGTSDGIEFGNGGAELIISRAPDEGISTRAVGSKEYLCYYRQKPRPTLNDVAITAVIAARYFSLGCSKIFPCYSKLKHEASYNFRPYSCPYAGSECPITGDIPFLVTHLRDDHKVDMHTGCTFNHRYVKSNPREVENATWILTITSICQEAGMHAVRKNIYVILPKDFEKGYKTNVKKPYTDFDFYK